jgi:hypothetical protein
LISIPKGCIRNTHITPVTHLFPYVFTDTSLLITYETGILGQAAVKKFFIATFLERKIMSTKTSFKRIALVAASALAFGGLSVVTATTAHAANENISGIAFSSSSDWSASTASTTPGTTTIPVAVTVVAGSTFYMNVVETGTAVGVETYQGALSTFADATLQLETTTADATRFGYDTGTGTVRTGSTFETVTTLVAPSTAGTYYLKATATDATSQGYAVVTVVNALATTYDGTIAGIGTATPSGVAGTNNTITISALRNSASGKAGYINVSGAGGTIKSIAGTASVIGATSGEIASTGTFAPVAVVINTPTAGTVTVTYAAESAVGSGIASTTLTTVTITVAATGSSGVLSVANSTVYDTTTIADTLPAAAALSAATGISTVAASTPVVRYTWTLKDALTNAFALSATSPASVVITGPGLLHTTNSHGGAAAKALALTSGSTGNFYAYGDGTSGVATITFSVGSTVVATKTLTFYSSTVKTLTATVNHGIVRSAAVAGVNLDSGTAGIVDYISVVAKDASGNAVPSLTNLTASSSSTSVVTTGAPTWDATDLVYYIPLTGVAKGSATITIKDSTGLISATGDVKVAKAVIADWSIAFDQTSYTAGDLVTVTITAKDSDGNLVADGFYTDVLAAKFATSQAVTSDIFGSELHFAAGVTTSTFYAPYAPGTLVISALVGSSATALSATVAALAGTKTLVTSADITSADSSASLALDAANAATDAANNAYDEAQNATQAASDALAAVTALAKQVKTLIASVKALTAAVAKLKK